MLRTSKGNGLVDKSWYAWRGGVVGRGQCRIAVRSVEEKKTPQPLSAKEGEHADRVGTGLLLVEHNNRHQDDAMTIDPATQEEIARLDQAVDDFASEMKARLREQARKGYRGWDDPENYQRIVEMMVKHAAVAAGEEVDVANLAMILWSLRRRRGGDLG
jgi:hypothetical protein